MQLIRRQDAQGVVCKVEVKAPPARRKHKDAHADAEIKGVEVDRPVGGKIVLSTIFRAGLGVCQEMQTCGVRHSACRVTHCRPHK